MNEELKDKLNEFLGKLIEGMEKAGNFAVDQIPDVVQQALTWFMVESLLWSITALPFLIISVWLPCSYFKSGGWWGEDPQGELVVPVLIGTLFFTGIGGCVLASNLEWLQILVAPKWFIVSEMSKLVG
jgi:hypothetical protein